MEHTTMTARIIGLYQWILASLTRWRPRANSAIPAVEALDDEIDDDDVYLETPASAANGPTASPVLHLERTEGSLAVLATVEAEEEKPASGSSQGVQAYPEEGSSCRWHFRAAILDRLDEYFACLRRVRRYDPDNYALFSRIGFSIPAVFVNPTWATDPVHKEWLQTAPRIAFGGILCGGMYDDDHDDGIYPSFVYFQKLKRPPRVECVRDGACYEFTIVYDDRRRIGGYWNGHLTLPLKCHIGLYPDGSIRLLREICQVSAPILRRCGRRRESFSLTTHRWRTPSWVESIAHETKDPEWADGEKFAVYLFVLAFLTLQSTQEKLIVRVLSDGTVATFGIDVGRAKYFFADRALELAADGRRKRIFHAVTEHTRRIKSGTTTVRDHFRGVRHFPWQGHQVQIVLPSKNHLLQFSEAGESFERIPATHRSEYYDQGDVGRILSQELAK